MIPKTFQKSIKDFLAEKIAPAVGVEPDLVKLEHPELETHGDYSTNLALVVKGGRLLAEKIVASLKPDDLIAKAEVAGPGFINIWLQNDYLVREIDRVITQGQDYGKSSGGQGKKAIIEYSSPNIAKRFGIGHLRSTIIGQALFNLYKFSGYEVIGDNHLGDWGTQFGKLLYMITETDTRELNIDLLEELYVEFHRRAANDSELEDKARKWFKKLEDGDHNARELWQKCVDISLAEFDRIYTLLGVKIDNAYGESSYEQLMPGVIEEAKTKGVARESEGAIIIEVPGEEAPIILVKSDGGTTYATRDLATLKFRRQKWDPDVVIYEVGGEQALHFRQVFAAGRMLGYVREGTSLIHTKHGLYLAPGGKKFSTRKGQTIKLEEILWGAIERAWKFEGVSEEVGKQVGVGAIKYYDLLHNVQSDIVFDWDKIMALEGNSGPYLQYTYARTRSLLAKGGRESQKVDGKYKPNDAESNIVRYLYRFPEVVSEAATRLSPNILCTYLYNLAQRFNTFYNQHSILSADNVETKKFRLALTAAVGQVIKNGLYLLGIEALEKM